MRPAVPDADRPLWQDVFAWLDRHADHEPDWADAVIAVLSGALPALKIWTYDRAFRTTWLRPDGRAIPLALR